MPVGYVISVLVIAICTVLAIRPVRRPRAVARLAFRLGIVPSELPQVATLLLVLATVLAAVEGEFAGPVAWVTAGVAVVVVSGHVVLARRALRARDVVADAVVASVGVRPPRRGLSGTLRILLTPYPARGRQVVRVADLDYAPGGKRHRLDVYHRRDRPQGAPVLVYLHGGGYFSGSKHRESRALVNRMVRRGWVCVAANYRLRPDAGFLDHLVDAKTVVAWVRGQVGQFGGDPQTVVMAGSSAGGHLAALCALTPNEPVLQPGFERVDTMLTAAVGLYGYYGWYYDTSPVDPVPSSPLAYDASVAPPVFLAHGVNDTYVPVAGARAMARHLRESSRQPVGYAELPGAQHAFDVYRSLRYEAVVDGVETFLGRVIGARSQVSGR